MPDPEKDVQRAVEAAVGADELAQRHVYRGGTAKGFNAQEFKYNAVDGGVVDIFEMSGDADAVERPVMGTRPEDLPERFPGLSYEGHREQSVTGGLTDSLGTAAHFGGASGMAEDLPLVLVLDNDRIPEKVVRVAYEYEWFNAHPGALGHVETLATGELYVNGELTATTDTEMNSPPAVQAWGRDRMENRTTSPTYVSEQEVMAFAPDIDLDSALLGVGSYYTVDAPRPHAIENVLSEFPGYAMRAVSWRDERDVSAMSTREMAEAAHAEAEALMQYAPDTYWTVLYDDLPGPGKGDTRITDEAFVLATNGERTTESPHDVPGFILGR